MLGTTLAPWPSYSDEEIEAVSEILRSGRVNQWTGSEVKAFETEFAAYCRAPHGVALANGTLALDVALRALGIGPGDEVVVTPRTFIASVSSVVLCGATPVFADVDRDSGNISVETIRAVLTDRTKAIVPVHLAGWPCDMPAIMKLARENDIAVIEDCAQAHGAKIATRSVGTFGDVGAFSFCQDKIISTGGEGGMVICADDDLWKRMWSFKDHGKSWDAVHSDRHPPGFRWLHHEFGTNWRMMEMQAAIGRIQLRRLDKWTERRAQIAERYATALSSFSGSVRVPLPPSGYQHAWYRFYAYVEPHALRDGWTRNKIVDEVNSLGIPLMQGSCSEVYREKAFEGTAFGPPQRLPVAHELGETSLMFLTHPTLDDGDVDRFAKAVTDVLAMAIR